MMSTVRKCCCTATSLSWSLMRERSACSHRNDSPNSDARLISVRAVGANAGGARTLQSGQREAQTLGHVDERLALLRRRVSRRSRCGTARSTFTAAVVTRPRSPKRPSPSLTRTKSTLLTLRPRSRPHELFRRAAIDAGSARASPALVRRRTARICIEGAGAGGERDEKRGEGRTHQARATSHDWR